MNAKLYVLSVYIYFKTYFKTYFKLTIVSQIEPVAYLM